MAVYYVYRCQRYDVSRPRQWSSAGSGAKKYTAVRFEYAKNARAVTYALGEQWCWNGSPTSCPTDYSVQWAREFRYDGGRQRYLDRELDPADLTGPPLSDTLTMYEGDEPYWSKTTVYGQPDVHTLTGYELGIARIHDPGGTPSTEYYHTDMLGTTRFLTDGHDLSETVTSPVRANDRPSECFPAGTFHVHMSSVLFDTRSVAKTKRR